MRVRKKNQSRRRGRPPGRTEQGDATRQRLYDAALKLIARKGYERSSLRDIAHAAGVSPGLLYRYFPSKRDVVLRLHDELSAEYAAYVRHSSQRRWVDRVLTALSASIETLKPHRDVLTALIPALVSNEGDGVLAPERAVSRLRVQDAFVAAITEAEDSPDRAYAEALGRLFYLGHLVFILLWLLDKTDEQRATLELLEIVDANREWVAMALVFPQIRPLVEAADALIQHGLLGVRSS